MLKTATVIFACFIFISLGLFSSCTGCYSFSGGSIGEAKTVSVSFFQNKASLVNPTLSQLFTESLKDKFQRDARLKLVKEDGDFDLSGYIVSYSVAPAAIQSDNQARLNRLTITVHVKFVNKLEPKNSYEQDFSGFADFDATKTLAAEESRLVEEINGRLQQDIFNKAVINW